MTTASTVRAVGILDELRRIVPTEQIEPEFAAERGGGWAVEPATQDELVDVLRWANDRGAAVFTRRPRPQDDEATGDRARIYLRGRRMQRVKDVDIVSGTATVQAGITTSRLHEVLGERGFTTGLPTRPWRTESLGSVLAACLDAHWGPHFGMMEEHVVSLGVLFPDGTPAHSRAAPRKAVGPDFDRLFLGSRGRFGIIYQATLRIFPSAARFVLAYAARDLSSALTAVRQAFDEGYAPRAVEILTPSPDRAWGRKRVGLSAERPILVIVEPWGPDCGRSIGAVNGVFGAHLEALEPPVGWDIHEGLLPAPREWDSSVVAVPWRELVELAASLGKKAPPGLWLVRLNAHGGWLSLAAGARGAGTGKVRAAVRSHLRAHPAPWDPIRNAVKARLDPRGILNPDLEVGQ